MLIPLQWNNLANLDSTSTSKVMPFLILVIHTYGEWLLLF